MAPRTDAQARRPLRAVRRQPPRPPLCEGPGGALSRIVHLGLGAFARAHLGEYTEDAGGGWEICGVAPSDRAVVGALARGRYTLITRGATDTFRVLHAFTHALHAPTQRAEVVAAIAAAEIVTLTVTEKAYREDAPIMALLRDGLAARDAPATVLSLDNLPRNGEVLARLVGDDRHRFPCSMVDRIVPAATDADRAAADDPAAVVAEPFRQWVLEAFDGPRPAWDALIVASSAPHEALKLRLLNGTHSLLAHVGLLLGHTTVAEAWADADIAAAADGLAVEDLIPTLPEVPGVDLADYRAQLARRWANPRIDHRLRQIALDAGQKLPARFGDLAPGRWIALTVAAHLAGGGDRAVLDALPAALAPAVEDWVARLAVDPRAALRAG